MPSNNSATRHTTPTDLPSGAARGLTGMLALALVAAATARGLAEPTPGEAEPARAEAPPPAAPGTLDTAASEPHAPAAPAHAELAMGGAFDDNPYADMSIEQLMDVELTAATLTTSSLRMTPASVTRIEALDIHHSGARSLDELLDISVPGLQVIRHNFGMRHVGTRGILSDRDDKWLLLVHGRNMNEKIYNGATTERDMALLGDLQRVDVVRGPGSVLYGPGALSHVVNLIPYTPRTFEGTQITARVGAIEEFYASEIKHGRRFGDDHGIFLYAGIAHHVGANEDFAPPVFGADTTVLGQSYEAGERATHTDFVKDNQAHRGLPKLKFHGHYTFGGFDFWARYTRGGVRHRAMNNLPDWYYFTGYQQATGTASYKHEPLDGLNMEYVFSYDMTDFEYGRAADNGMAWRTDEYYAKALADYKPWEGHHVAGGFEYSYEFNGLPSPGYPNYDDKGWHYRFFSDPDTNGGDMPRWQTQMYSFVGEWQWTINDHWTTFLGGRADKHSYTDWLYSPRASVILTPNERDTFKAIYSRSTRTNLGAEMRVNWTTNGTQSRPEVLDMAEFRWERRHTDNLWLAFSGHYYNQNLIGWDTGNTKTGGLGRLKWFGLELESTYKNDRTRVTFSHSFTKLINFEPSAGTETFVTTEQFGFGRELNNWANHLTKITARRDINDRLNVDGSVRIYWGMPGNRSAAEYAISPRGEDNPTLWDPSYDVPFKPKAYLNLGLTYEPTDNTSVRFDAYNVLGWINDDLNQRLYANFDVNVSAAESRVMAPAFGVKATIEF